MSARFPLTGTVGVLMEQDVDTDIIYPARFLLLTDKRGLGQYAFSYRRADSDFPLPLDGSRSILVAGANFGCGSSREHAVWALHDFGIRAIIAPSFGEIFYTNCTRNGIVPIRLPQDVVAALAAHEGQVLTIDLEACRIMAKVSIRSGSIFPQAIARRCSTAGTRPTGSSRFMASRSTHTNVAWRQAGSGSDTLRIIDLWPGPHLSLGSGGSQHAAQRIDKGILGRRQAHFLPPEKPCGPLVADLRKIDEHQPARGGIPGKGRMVAQHDIVPRQQALAHQQHR